MKYQYPNNEWFGPRNGRSEGMKAFQGCLGSNLFSIRKNKKVCKSVHRRNNKTSEPKKYHITIGLYEPVHP